MGQLLYGLPPTIIELDDRVLAHVKAVIFTKLRRDERFTLSWTDGLPGRADRNTIWIHPAIPLQFKTSAVPLKALNHAWMEELLMSANSPNGLQITPEPSDPAQPM